LQIGEGSGAGGYGVVDIRFADGVADTDNHLRFSLNARSREMTLRK
jgi:hypothetical protein